MPADEIHSRPMTAKGPLTAGSTDPGDHSELLRKTISRLCIAATGGSERLDRVLASLTTLVRRPVTSGQLAPLVDELTAAITALDEPQGRSRQVATAPASDVKLGVLLSRLLERVPVAAPLKARAGELRQQLHAGSAEREPLKSVDGIAELINRHTAKLQQDHAAAEQVLGLVTTRLEEMAAHLRYQDADTQLSQDHSNKLNTQLLGEVRELGSNVHTATELGALQSEVRTRLELIDGHLREFREREDARVRENAERSRAMKSRIESLERETQTLQHSVQREHQLAMTDALTGIPNRQAYQLRIEELVAGFGKTGRPACIVACDIDRFKVINDTYGHQAGDKVLQVVARLLAKQLRASDFVARFGGEEFVLLLDSTLPADALKVADKLRQTVEAIDFKSRDEKLTVTISFGVTALVDGDTVDSAFARADAALYEAKRAGRNRCELR